LFMQLPWFLEQGNRIWISNRLQGQL
jgi:hypothetical protein